MRELTAPATLPVGDHDSIVHAVFSHERDNPDYPIFQRLAGRKKEIIVTAGGKNVAPAVLEDRLSRRSAS